LVSVKAEGGSYAIDTQKFQKITKGKTLIELENSGLATDELSQKITEKCGTHALVGYTLGAYYMAKLEFNFANQSDKAKFEGRLKASIDAFTGEGSLNVDFSEFNESTSVTLKIIQKGGDSIQSAAGLSEQILHCNPSDMTACLNSIRRKVPYLFPCPRWCLTYLIC
jgi:hypothetical protein